MSKILKQIIENPYRIIGVAANSKTKEIKSNFSKFSSFARINKSSESNFDFNSFLSKVTRTTESLEKAQSELTSENERLQWALFWFIKETDTDINALASLAQNNQETAIGLWHVDNSALSHQHNLAILALINGKTADYLSYIQNLATNLPKLCSVLGLDLVTQKYDELIKFVLDILKANDISIESVTEHLDGDLRQKIQEDKEKSLTEDFDKVISKYDAFINNSKATDYSGCNNFVEEIIPILDGLRQLIGTNDFTYSMREQKTVNSLIGYGRKCFNDINDEFKLSPLTSIYSLLLPRLAINENIQKLQNEINEIENKIKNLPDPIYREQYERINNIILNIINTLSYSSANDYLALLEQVVAELNTIILDEKYFKCVCDLILNISAKKINLLCGSFEENNFYKTKEILENIAIILNYLSYFEKTGDAKNFYDNQDSSMRDLIRKFNIKLPSIKDPFAPRKKLIKNIRNQEATTPPKNSKAQDNSGSSPNNSRSTNSSELSKKTNSTSSSNQTSSGNDNSGCLIFIIVIILIAVCVNFCNSRKTSSNTSTYSSSNANSSTYSSSSNQNSSTNNSSLNTSNNSANNFNSNSSSTTHYEKEQSLINNYKYNTSGLTPKEAINMLKNLQNNHDYGVADYLIGEQYFKEKNILMAKFYYKKSIEQDNSEGMRRLADLYFNDKNEPDGKKKSIDLYQKSANLGNKYSIHAMGTFIEDGTYFVKNINLAIKYYKKATQLGFAPSYTRLGSLYFKGEKVKQNKTLGCEYFGKSAALGNAWGMLHYADCYFKNDHIAWDPQKAFKWYKAANDKDPKLANYRLGVMYATGMGTTANYRLALKHLDAAAPGNRNASGVLALMYYNGDGVFPLDHNKAFQWAVYGSKKGGHLAQMVQAIMHEQGDQTAIDLEKSFKYARMSAINGNAYGQLMLSKKYYYHSGTTFDMAEAYAWARIASECEYVDQKSKKQMLDNFETINSYMRSYQTSQTNEAIRLYRKYIENSSCVNTFFE